MNIPLLKANFANFFSLLLFTVSYCFKRFSLERFPINIKANTYKKIGISFLIAGIISILLAFLIPYLIPVPPCNPSLGATCYVGPQRIATSTFILGIILTVIGIALAALGFYKRK